MPPKAVIYTSSWSHVYAVCKAGGLLDTLPIALPFSPVRISVGKPRFWSNAGLFTHVSQLAPYGLMSTKLTDEEFKEKYIARLEKAGVEQIRYALLAASHPGKAVVLCCYEKVEDLEVNEDDCHRRTFAHWWEQQTGERIPELEWARAQIIERPVVLPSETEERL
jgi:hypothetical protein